MESLLSHLKELLAYPLFVTEKSQITVLTVILFVTLIIVLFSLSNFLQRFIQKKILKYTKIESGAQQSVATIFKYAFVALGLVLIIQNTGIDLSAFSMLAGAVGIGVGFGLQNVVNNFIAGIIILFERPIKIGDRIEINKIEGTVKHIGARSTHVLTNNNITIIVPNSKFITENIVNWTLAERLVRFQIPVTVAYGTDFESVEKLLLKSVAENPNVLKFPEPGVRFLNFGENGIELELRAWSSTQVDRKGRLVSSINASIYKIFMEEGVKIPAPQREVSLKNPPQFGELK